MRGDITPRHLADLFRAMEQDRRTGVLILIRDEVEKCFCFKDGGIIFVSSKKRGERLGEFLSTRGRVREEVVKRALYESRDKGIPFTQFLIERGIVESALLVEALEELAAAALADVFGWGKGEFEFTEGLPAIVSRGPVFISSRALLNDLLRKSPEDAAREDL